MIDPATWTGIGGMVAALGVGIWHGVEKYSDYRKRRDHDLEPNPERCAEERAARIRIDFIFFPSKTKRHRLEESLDHAGRQTHNQQAASQDNDP